MRTHAGTSIRDSLNNYELGHEAQVALANRDGEAILGNLSGFSKELLEHAESQWVDGFRVTRQTGDGGDGFIGAHSTVGGTD
ncbi:MAG: hypothetical protein IH936_13805 [Acidobacteria bacterium]|nr:hypothetical protein [Acidobacteriota bacterium]